ncbi:hypothetical protein ACF3NA_09720 [Alkanindiges sp. WGS2144]|uniref:hypothetical protein n=1 Tax=Alkanindiges sp. WGS2144 TaxID=3366808 RepID=UPI00375193DF
MTQFKQLAALTVLASALAAPSITLAEPTPPAGTTVDTIALTNVQTNVSSSTSMDSSSNSMINNHGATTNSDMMPHNDMGMPMTSDPDASNEDNPAVNNNAGTTPTP